jgi:hypothetical protein
MLGLTPSDSSAGFQLLLLLALLMLDIAADA